jgi:hypothetical protein
VKFIAGFVKPGILAVPAGAALLFVFVTSRLFPRLPWIVTVAAGGFLFY